MIIRHAPRERVSWNKDKQAKQQRVFPSRSTWACELKYSRKPPFPERLSHAPRERVSWNISSMVLIQLLMVTLHVSVWVEISNHRHYGCDVVVTLHVSVWVEILIAGTLSFGIASHAPRERVSWNILEEKEKNSSAGSRSTWACELKWICVTYHAGVTGHAPRERVSWNKGEEMKRGKL